MWDRKPLIESLEKMPGTAVLCIGDVMWDRYIYGAIDRISPEAPIPVLHVKNKRHMLGGTGNVIANLQALGAKVFFTTVVGEDTAAGDIQSALEAAQVTTHLIRIPGRQTTIKTRYVCGTQQVLRVDQEVMDLISTAAEDQIIAFAKQVLPNVSVVLLSDYNKGVLTPRVVAEVIAAARQQDKPVIVDPKARDFRRYRGATVITPNRKELEAATDLKCATDEDVQNACLKIMQECEIDSVLATRGKDGMAFVQSKGAPLFIPANTREVFDVSGAGDTVMATFSLALGAGIDVRHAVLLANAAAGIVVGKAGTAVALPQEIKDEIDRDQIVADKQTLVRKTKLVTRAEAAVQAAEWRARGYTVGFTNGTFDLVHPGHISSMRQAKAACDYLIVAINSDASVKRYKGPTRPVQDEQTRATILSALEMIDLVVIFEEDTPVELLKAIKPDVLVKGGQYKLEEVVGYDIVIAYGGRIVRADMEEGHSTTNTIKKMGT